MLATHGVLFLDEMGEFPAAVLDALRQPLEDGVVRVSRAHATATYPARFLLVGATYPRGLSGPLLDRFDLVVPLRRPDPDELLRGGRGEQSAEVARRVAA